MNSKRLSELRYKGHITDSEYKELKLAIKALEKDKCSSCKPTLIRKILEDFERWYKVNGNDLKVIRYCGVWGNLTEFVPAIDEYMKERGFEK